MTDEFSEAMDLPTIKQRNTIAEAFGLPDLFKDQAATRQRLVREEAARMMEAKPKDLPPSIKKKAWNTREHRQEQLRRAAKKGPVATNSDEKGHQLAQEHAKLAEDHGWVVELLPNTDNGWKVVAKQDDCTATVAWVNGKVDYPSNVAEFPTHTFWLKHTAQWRRQITLPENERPASRTPKQTTRRANQERKPVQEATPVINGDEPESVPFNLTSLPFAHDDEDAIVIGQIRGRRLFWRNNLAQRVSHADVPSNPRVIRLAAHPKSGRRIVSFPEVAEYSAQHGEILGGERSVALEDMIRVRDSR